MSINLENTKWYSTNFSNEQVLQGNQTTFLRLQNTSHLLGVNVQEDRDIWILPIPEIVNVDPDDTSYDGQVFFNGEDVQKTQRVFKDLISGSVTTNYEKLKQTENKNIFWYGGPETGSMGASEYAMDFPFNRILNTTTSSTTQWIKDPMSGSNGSFKYPGEKTNFRIDYKGNKHLVVKITFFLTTKNPAQGDFWDAFPNIDGVPGLGNVRLNGTSWEYDSDGTGTWTSFNPAIDTASNDWPVYGIKHLHMQNMFMPNTSNPSQHWHDFQETYVMCYPENDNKPSRDTEYWIDKDIAEDHLHEDESSYMLMRTNPKLSGNIKMVIDSEGLMYLDTIEANDQLSNAKFKKNRISPNGSYPVDIKRYYSSLAPEILYDVKEKDDQYLNSKKVFSEQYDFFYGYGAEQLPSKYYDEHFKLFAPLWIRKKLPDFFVIFKTPGPLSKETYKDNNREAILKEMMVSAQIIDTFDMREGSNIGQYLGTLVNDPRFDEQPLKISYEKDTLSEWSGISYQDGILSSKGEYLYDFFTEDRSINEFEEIITKGYERNGIISTNLINFEFLFNDEESSDYDINRYFGMYVNEIELAKFEIYADGLEKIIEQTPIPKKDVDGEPYSTKEFTQTNAAGIVVPIDYYQGNGPIGSPERTGLVEGKLPLNESVEDPFRFFYIRDREDNIDRIKEVVDYEFNNLGDPNHLKYTGLRLFDNVSNMSNYAGISKMTGQLPSTLLNAGRSQLVINFKDTLESQAIIENGEYFEIEWIDINQDKQLWRCVANDSGLQPGDAWDFPQYNPDEFLYLNNFSSEGTPEQLANAFATCINNFNNSVITAWTEGANVYLRADIPSLHGNGIAFRRKMIQNSIIQNVTFYSFDSVFNPDFSNPDVSISMSTTGSVLSFIEDITSLTCNVYEVKVLDVTGAGTSTIIKVQIKKNGGLIETISLDLLGSVIPPIYDSNGIKFEFEGGTGIEYTANDKWTFSASDKSVTQRFIGGSSRNRNRASVLIDDALNINKNDWYQTQKGKYSRLKKWDVQGNDHYKLPDLETELLLKDNVIGYKDLSSKIIIEVEDTNFEFYQTVEKRIVSFDAFEPTLGIMSFLPIKDFDFDWIQSDYAYTPSAEVFRFYESFEIINEEPLELELGQYFEITNGSVFLEGWNETEGEWQSVKAPESDLWTSSDIEFRPTTVANFNTFLPNYYYETEDDKSDKIGYVRPVMDEKFNYFYRNYKILESVSQFTKLRLTTPDIANIQKYAYGQDKNLDSFNGFLGLSDFFSVEDEEELEKLIEENDTDRFFFEQLLSEYDRLRENFNKDYAVKSRVVPFINKWTHKGSDCRDNKYRLNNSMAFGLTSFAPDTEIRERNPRLHTHEFFYLDEYPEAYPSELLANSRSYFFQNITTPVYEGKSWNELFRQNDNDWFSKYLTIGYPNELNSNGIQIEKKTEERYVFTDFVKGDEFVQGIFRGGKFRIKDIDSLSKDVIESSTKFDNYKFSSILKIQKLSFSGAEPPSKFEFIMNEKYQTILLVITLFVNDYRIQEGGYGYLFLYASSDALKASDQKNERMLFNDSGNTASVEYTSTSFLAGHETQRHFEAFRGGAVVTYADIKLNGIFDTYISPASSNPRILNAISTTSEPFIPLDEIFPIDGNDYDMQQIFNPGVDGQLHIDVMERGQYSEISQYLFGLPVGNPTNYIVNNQPGLDQQISVESDKVKLSGDLNLGYVTAGDAGTTIGFPVRKTQSLPSSIIPNETSTSISAWYLSGGKDYLNQRLEEISFAEIINKVNNDDTSVIYLTVTDDGVIDGDYKFEFIDFDRIDKQNRLIVIEDTEKPEVYQDVDIIGFDIESNLESEAIFRHRGRFEPKTRKVINYWLREDVVMSTHYNTDYLLSNTRLGIEHDNFGFINNLFYSKIADTEIMKISSSEKFKSLYPMINEVAIDNKDFFLFNSNWDNNYYEKYQTRSGKSKMIGSSVTTPELFEGTNELKEQKSFFGSKMMVTPDIYELHEFNEDELQFNLNKPLLSTDIKSLRRNNKKNKSVVPRASKGKLTIDIFADNRLIREMLDNDAAREFFNLKTQRITRFANLSDDEITEEARKYLLANILSLYKVSAVALYIKSDADEESDEIVRIDLSESEKRNLNYILSKNTKVKKESDYKFQIIQEIDTKKYKSFSASITLERI